MCPLIALPRGPLPKAPDLFGLRKGFVCTCKTSRNQSRPLAVGQRVERASGIAVTSELWDAVWDCDEWPFRLYEIEIDPHDLFAGQRDHSLIFLTSAFRVVRAVAMEEVLGPRAGELGPQLADLQRLPWLAPKRPVDVAAAEALVREVYAVAAGLTKLRAAPMHLVERWDEACRADLGATASGAPGSVAALLNLERDAQLGPLEATRYNFPMRALRRAFLRQCYGRMWDAGWDAAFGDFQRRSTWTHARSVKSAERAWTKLRDKVTARHDDMRRAAALAAQRMLGAEAMDDEVSCEGLEGRGVCVIAAPAHPLIADMLRITGMNEVALSGWNFSVSALSTALSLVEMTVAEVERSVSQPLLELFRMGLWPIGDAGGSFVVYAPRAT